MQLPKLIAILMLTGLLVACQTTDEDGVDQADVDAGGLGPLPDAPDAVVRLEVEDYQQYLSQVIREYRFCVRATALEIDDGVSDPSEVIEGAQRRCEHEYRTAHRVANLLNDVEEIESLRAESRAAALESLIAVRAPS